jgi:radical SAM superfamily enzyme YgiQ (UPF0313 family)
MSPDRIVQLLDRLKVDLGVAEVEFDDELFLAGKAAFRELAPKLKRLGIRWGAQARVNLVDRELLLSMKDVGCIGVGYGIESGSQRILDNMNKQTTVAQIETAMRETRAARIPVKVQLIFGYPGEDETTVQETIDLFDRVDHPGRRFNVITPLPGSKLYDDCIQEGRIRDEAAYLHAIEKSFGIPKVHVNFTPWPDDEIYPRKRAAEQQMLRNYVNKSWVRRARALAGRLRHRLAG